MHLNNSAALEKLIRDAHKCDVVYVGTVRVTEAFDGKPAWEGTVDIFRLKGHPNAEKCYGWQYQEGDEIKSVTVLAIPPVTTPILAVRAAIASKARQ